MAAQRLVVAGGNGADVMALGTAAVFAWLPDPGDAAHIASGDGVWSTESRAAGAVLFLGVAAEAPFASRPAGFAFAFTRGVEAGPEAVAAGGPWLWDPVSGLLDPQGAQDGRYGQVRFFFAHNKAGEVAADDPEWTSHSDSLEEGRWVPAPVPALTAMSGAGDDRVLGTAAAERILGGDGADTLEAGGGRDTIDGQRGDDLILGGAARDIASGGSGADTLRGAAGNDILHGFVGDDLLVGGAGLDHLLGGEGDDRIEGVPGEGDTIAGGAGFDTLDVSGGSPLSARALGVRVDLVAGTIRPREGDGAIGQVSGIEKVVGTAGWDEFVCGPSGTVIEGGGGTYDLAFAGIGLDRFVLGTGPLGPYPAGWDNDPAMGINRFDVRHDKLDLRAFGVTRADVYLTFIEHHGSLEVSVRNPADGDIEAVAYLWGVSALPKGVDFLIT